MLPAPATRLTLSAAAAIAVVVGLAFPSRAQLVISQIYGGGGQQGSLYTADFVELHNTGNVPIDLAQGPWALHSRAGAPGGTSTWTKIVLNSGTIAPGGYYLIRTTTPTTTFLQIDLPPADATAAAPDLQAPVGQMLLTLGNATLPMGAACLPNITGGTLADFVGWGALASCNEPVTPQSTTNNAPTGDSRTAIFRRLCGASDTNNNGADFTTGLPNPRNSSTAPSIGLSAWANASPAVIRVGDAVLLTVVPRMCAGGRVFGASVAANLAPLGGSPSQPLLDDGTSGDEVSNDGIYSRLVTISPTIGPGTKNLAVTALSGANSGGTFISLAISSAAGPLNDSCRAAAPIAPAGASGTPGSYGSDGVTITGNLTGAREEANPVNTQFTSTAGLPSMNGNTGAKRGVWYTVVGTGTTMSAETCSTTPSFDSIVQVLCGSCDGLSLVSAGEDECGVLSRAMWCSTAGQTYLVWVARHSTNGGASTNAFTLKITDDGLACTADRSCMTCLPSIPPGSLDEGETAPGPSLNDGCDASTIAGAIAHTFTTISVGQSPLTIAGSSRAYGAGAAVAGSIDSDWFRFQATGTDALAASVVAQFPVLVQVRSLSATGGCTGNAIVASATADRCTVATLAAPVTAANWYAVRVTPNLPAGTNNNSGFAAAALSSQYVLTLQMNAPTSQTCAASASPMTVSGDGSGSITFTVIVTPGTNPLGTTHTVTLDLTSVGGNVSVPMVEGPPNTFTYVHSIPVQTPPGTRTITATTTEIAPGNRSSTCSTTVTVAAGSPANDTCASAQLIAENSTTEGSTALAIVDQDAPFCLGLVLPAAQALNPAPAGVWYRINPTNSGTITAHTFAQPVGSPVLVDTEIRVFSGSCAGLTCITANDDLGPPAAPLRSKVAWPVVAGIDYYILVNPNSAAEASFALTLTHSPTPENDACASATILSPTGGTLTGTTIGATGLDGLGQGTDAAGLITAPGCAGSRAAFDVWYSIIPICTGPMTFETCGAYDTLLSIHTACPESLPGDVHMLASGCSNDGPPGCAPGSSLTIALAAGTQYLLRVAGAHGYDPAGAFSLTWHTAADSAQPPTSATADPASFCLATPPSSITLTASGGAGDTLEWFSDTCGSGGGGSLVGTGSPLIIAPPTATTTYFARWTTACNASNCAQVTVQVDGTGSSCCGGACCIGAGLGKTCTMLAAADCAPAGPSPTRAYRGDCTVCTPNSCCPADFSNNGIVNVQDIFAFLTAWYGASAAANFDNVGPAPSVADIFGFLTQWFSGC